MRGPGPRSSARDSGPRWVVLLAVLVVLGGSAGCVGPGGSWFDAGVPSSTRERVRGHLDRIVLAYRTKDSSGILRRVREQSLLASGSFREVLEAHFRSVQDPHLALRIDRITEGSAGPVVHLHWTRRWRPGAGGGTVEQYGEATFLFVHRGDDLLLEGMRGGNPFF